MHRGLMGAALGGGGQKRGGGGGVEPIVGVGGQQRGGGGVSTSTSKNRPSHHKYKSPRQFELKQT